MGGRRMSDSSDLVDRLLQGIPVEMDKKLVIITPIMTVKQYAAIHLKVPRSGDQDIDTMIWESRRAEFAGLALGGNVFGDNVCDRKALATSCFAVAGAMLAEWEKGNENSNQ
jgi:hypothetical protein